MQELIVCLLVVDVFLSYFYRYLDSQKPRPLSSTEFYFLLAKHQDDLVKILEEENKELRKELFNNYLKTRDLINLKSIEKK